MRRADTNALLTGGLGSLGQAQAVRLAAAGVRVTILEHPDVADGEARAAALGAGFVACDLNDLVGSQTIVSGAAERAGGFDILINNAALIINRPFESFSLQEYEDQIRVNSSSAFALSAVCAKTMKERRWGRSSTSPRSRCAECWMVMCPMWHPRARCWV